MVRNKDYVVSRKLSIKLRENIWKVEKRRYEKWTGH